MVSPQDEEQIELVRRAMMEGLDLDRDRNGKLVIKGEAPPPLVLEHSELDWILRVEGRGPDIEDLPRNHQTTIMLSELAWSGLNAWARKMNYIRGGHGNVGLLMEAIGQGKLVVGRPDRLEPNDDVSQHGY